MQVSTFRSNCQQSSLPHLSPENRTFLMMISHVRRLGTLPSHIYHVSPSLQSTFLQPHQFPPHPFPTALAPCLEGTLEITRQMLDFSCPRRTASAYTRASFLNITRSALPLQDFWNFETTQKHTTTPLPRKVPSISLLGTPLDLMQEGMENKAGSLG